MNSRALTDSFERRSSKTRAALGIVLASILVSVMSPSVVGIVDMVLDGAQVADQYASAQTSGQLVIKALSLDGSRTLNMWTTVNPGAQQTGFTPMTVTGSTGQSYRVAVADYEDIIFDHWDDGSKNRSKTVNMNRNVELTAYYKTGTTNAPSVAPSGSPAPGKDRFDINTIYPSLAGGRSWDSKWDNGISRSFGNSRNDPSDPLFITSKNGGGLGEGSYETAGDGILKISGEYPRMYVADPSKNWRNVEITVYGKRMSDSNISWAGIVAAARSNHGVLNNENSQNCDNRGLIGHLTYTGKTYLEKETSHHSDNGYAQVQTKTVWNGGMPKNTWIGMKFIVRDMPNNQVKMELYKDETNGLNGGTWTKVSEFIDNGNNFGTGNTACDSGVNPGLPLTSSNSRSGSETGRPNVAVYFRSDGVGTDGLLYKNASVREISPLT